MKKVLLISILFVSTLHGAQNIAVIGTGYVGLVTGAGLAELGNRVTCVDIDTQKIELLNNNIIPIYELGLNTLVQHNRLAEQLLFTSDIAHAIQQADIIFIAVGTPMGDDGSADLSYVHAVLRTIAQNMNAYKTIITKSTVPIGTGRWIRTTLEQDYNVPSDMFELISNPEFLREGSAVADFMYPDRLVIGTESDYGRATMHTVYKKLIDEDNVPVLWTNVVTAESIKYASNGFLALKLSFINEMANLCDATGADINQVARGMGFDKRISSHFLQAGPGFGGSCFPKDSSALLHMADEHNLPFHTVHASLHANDIQKEKPVEKLLQLMNNDITGKTIAVLGLAFKAQTDDVRYSPAITAIHMLLKHGAHVRAYDPEAMKNMSVLFPDTITYCNSAYEALTHADGALIITDWDEFKTLNIAKMAELMNQRILVDARNIMNERKLESNGFIFDFIGRSYLAQHAAVRRHKALALESKGAYGHNA
jgi:UDPglucose 6-dehydrogenase